MISETWEYKEIWIREVPHQQFVLPKDLSPTNPSLLELKLPELFIPENFHPLLRGFDKYYEFLDPVDNNWTALLNINEEISSISLVTIFDHFGINGWELVSFSKEEVLFSNKETYYCIFKRKIEENYDDNEEV